MAGVLWVFFITPNPSGIRGEPEITGFPIFARENTLEDSPGRVANTRLHRDRIVRGEENNGGGNKTAAADIAAEGMVPLLLVLCYPNKHSCLTSPTFAGGYSPRIVCRLDISRELSTHFLPPAQLFLR